MNVPDKSCKYNQNTLFMLNHFFVDNHALYEIMWRNIVEPTWFLFDRASSIR